MNAEVLHTDDVLVCKVCEHGASAHRYVGEAILCSHCPGGLCAPRRRPP